MQMVRKNVESIVDSSVSRQGIEKKMEVETSLAGLDELVQKTPSMVKILEFK